MAAAYSPIGRVVWVLRREAAQERCKTITKLREVISRANGRGRSCDVYFWQGWSESKGLRKGGRHGVDAMDTGGLMAMPWTRLCCAVPEIRRQWHCRDQRRGFDRDPRRLPTLQTQIDGGWIRSPSDNCGFETAASIRTSGTDGTR